MKLMLIILDISLLFGVGYIIGLEKGQENGRPEYVASRSLGNSTRLSFRELDDRLSNNPDETNSLDAGWGRLITDAEK